MKLLRRLLPRPSLPAPGHGPQDLVPPAPAQDVYVVGDIHGRLDLVETLLTRIDADIAGRGTVDPQLVFVGDYIDRGDQSVEVLDFLHDLDTTHPQSVTCLMGNHERMMLDFLNDPIKSGPRWLRNGGLQTLASFRVSAAGVGEVVAPDVFFELAASLRKQMPQGLEDWLTARPLVWSSGSVWVVHAAADPGVAMRDQESTTLLWGNGDFGNIARHDGQWVVHGHTIVDQPSAHASRISVDTGAVYTGRLTAASIRTDGSVTFLST